MVATTRFCCVAPDSLTSFPERYSFSRPPDEAAAELAASLASHGLLRPLTCVAGDAGLVVAHGARRLAALRAAEAASVAVRVVEVADSMALWDLLLAEQADGGGFNPAEQALYLAKRQAATGESREQLAASCLPRFGLAPKATALDDWLWLAGLPDVHLEGFARGLFPVQSLGYLARAPRADVLAALDLIGCRRVSVNKFAELVQWLCEVAWGQGLSVADWVAREMPDGAASGDALHRALRDRRFPRLREWEDGFAAAVQGLQLPREVRVSAPRGFEGGTLTCTTVFHSVHDLAAQLRGLLTCCERGELDRLDPYLT